MVESTRTAKANTKPAAAKTTTAKPAATKKPALKTPGCNTKGVSGLNNDKECPVCLTLCVQPCRLPCKHVMCMDCSKQITKMGMTCPMCRAHFDKLFIPVLDEDLQHEIEEEKTEEFNQIKAQLKKDGKWNIKKLLRFAYGNTHEEIKDAKPSNSSAEHTNSHRWAMFVCFNDDHDLTSKYIKSVTYHLHPTFKVNKIKLTEAPFLLSRIGWGYFEI